MNTFNFSQANQREDVANPLVVAEFTDINSGSSFVEGSRVQVRYDSGDWYHGTISRLTALPDRHPQCEAVIEYDDGTTEVATIPDDDVQLERPCSVFLLSEFSGYAPNKSSGASCASAGAGASASTGAAPWVPSGVGPGGGAGEGGGGS